VNHLTDDELVLHYYGEDGARLIATGRHLQSCPQCARSYDALARTLRAITPPDTVEAGNDLATLRALLHERSRSRVPARTEAPWMLPGASGLAIALVWLAALLYPFSFRALFSSAQLAQAQALGLSMVALTLAWTCAGPLVAVLSLNQLPADGFERVSARVLVLGALIAAVSPALYLLVSRVDTSLSLDLGLWSWFSAVGLTSLLTLVRWPHWPRSTGGFLYVHRLSALLLTVFVLGHVVNQAIAFVSLSSYAAMRSVMRVVSTDPVMYAVVVTAVAIQVVSGAAMGMRKVRAGATARNLQAVSGWYLAAFLLTHVFSALLFRPPPQVAAAVAPAASQFNLLASAGASAQLPFLLLGVAAFLFHVGIYARLTALAYLAEVTVRRLSYAAMFVGTTVVVTVGLALCGIHLVR